MEGHVRHPVRLYAIISVSDRAAFQITMKTHLRGTLVPSRHDIYSSLRMLVEEYPLAMRPFYLPNLIQLVADITDSD